MTVNYYRVRALVGQQLYWAARNLEGQLDGLLDDGGKSSSEEATAIKTAIASVNQLGQWVDVALGTEAGCAAIEYIRTVFRHATVTRSLEESVRAALQQAIAALGAPVGMTASTGGG